MIKKWLRARRWKNGLYAAFLRYNQLEQFDKSVRIAKRLGDDELAALVAGAIDQSGAASMKDMGKVMALVKPQVQGRADMGQVSALVKSSLQ